MNAAWGGVAAILTKLFLRQNSKNTAYYIAPTVSGSRVVVVLDTDERADIDMVTDSH